MSQRRSFSAALMRVYLNGGYSVPLPHTHNFRSTVQQQLGQYAQRAGGHVARPSG